MGGVGQFADLREGWQKKKAVFEGNGYPNARHGKLNQRLTSFFLGVKL